MINITPVSTFTAPVTVVADGDSVNGANSQATAQALTNRTQELSDRVGTRDAASGFVGLDANKRAAVTATSGDAITGTATSGSGVTGNATSGTGVEGNGTSGYGVLGTATTGTAVFGTVSGIGTAVYAQAFANGYCFYSSPQSASARSAMYLEISVGCPGLDINTAASPTFAPIRLRGSAQPTGPNEIGDIYMTVLGVLKVCTVAGTPGTWVSVGTQT